MRALCWHGKGDIRCDHVPDPKIEDGRDVIIKVTSTAICGSDLHLMDGFIPTMQSGDVLGHEFMGEVVETGAEHRKFKVGDRIVVPFTICCGACEQCLAGNWSVCERSNRNREMAEKVYGYTTAGLFGYSHLTGGFAGGQAEYVRVPFADVAPVKVPDGMGDEQALFLTDIFPTGWQAAVNCDIQPKDTIAIWGCGPVAQFCIKSCFMLGAKRVIAIDRVPERLALARASGAETIDFKEENVLEQIWQLTGGHGPDKVIDGVGLEAHGSGSIDAVYDKAKTMLMMETDRAHALREAIMACRPGGIVSIPGVYGGLIDKFPMGPAFQKGLTFRMGQTHVKRYLEELMRRIEEGQIDPTFVITHRAKLEEGPDLYKTFRDKEDGCIKVVLQP